MGTCYSFLEYQLIEICKDEKKKKSLRLDISQLKGNGIERSKNYLKMLAGIDFPEDASWNEIMFINRIRNIIVHNDRILDGSDKSNKIQEYIEARLDISLNIKNTIILNANYCGHVVDVIETFLGELYHMRQEATS